MTRYLLGVNFQAGIVDVPMEEWTPREITSHLDYYKALHEELDRNGFHRRTCRKLLTW